MSWDRGDTHHDEPVSGDAVGVSEAKIDGLTRIRGATYVDDLVRPRMVVAKFHRSPHPHARITSVDLTAALAVPGVVGGMVGADLPVRYGALPVARDETALAVDLVRYVGEPVACIAAIDEETAHRACRLVRVTYEILAPVLTIDEALADDAPRVHPEGKKASNVLRRVHQSHGDVDAAFASAGAIVDRTFDYPGSTHVPLEPHAALAEVLPDGRLILTTSTQNPHYVHREIARILGMRDDQVRVIKPAVGAGYGGKCEPFCTDVCAAFLARKLDRPVKISLEREEVFYAHRGRHPTRLRVRLGVNNDGTIAAIELNAVAAGGAYASYGVVTAYYLGVFLTLPYRVSAMKFEAIRLYTNEPPCGPKRGHGAIQPRFAVECALDEAAAAIGMDPAEIRRINAVPDGHVAANGLIVGTSGMKACLDAVIAASGWAERHGKLGPGRGLGIAASAYLCGALHPVYDNDMAQSIVQLKVDRSGEITLFSGTSDVGQGSTDMLARLCAERLGVRPADVHVIEGDTSITPVDLGSYSSRVTFMAGNACLMAADAARARLFEVAAAKLGVPVDALVARDRKIGVPNGVSVDFQAAIRLAEEAGGPIGTVGSYRPEKIGSRFRRSSVGPSPAYSFTAQVVEVVVDEETGICRVIKVWCAHDVGRALNPAICEGQIEGCVYMGVGEALYEHQAYRNGVVQAASILEYKIPTVHETPDIVPILIETCEPGGPYGAKEVGEGPQLPTVPAIANAIADAIGVRPTSAPFTPDRLLKLIDRRGTR